VQRRDFLHGSAASLAAGLLTPTIDLIGSRPESAAESFCRDLASALAPNIGVQQPFIDWLPGASPSTWRFDGANVRFQAAKLQELLHGGCDKGHINYLRLTVGAECPIETCSGKIEGPGIKDYDGKRKRRMMLFEPPRHFKTETVTVRFPVYFMQDNPVRRVLLSSYNQDFTNKVSRKMRRVAEGRLDIIGKLVQDWELQQGGGVTARGVGAGAAGLGAHLIIIDDPIKSHAEANSPTYREGIWEWWSDEIFTRQEPEIEGGEALMILMFARWHEDDLAGRIMDSEDAEEWAVINVPAEAETQEERDYWAKKWGLEHHVGQPDPLGRQPGEALDEDRFPSKKLEKFKKVVIGYSGLYQGRPRRKQGRRFQEEWFNHRVKWDQVPKRNMVWVRYWDKAGTEGGGKRTAGVLMGIHQPTLMVYVADSHCGQWEAHKREREIKNVALADSIRFGSKSEVTIYVEQEPGSGGLESAMNTVKNLIGYKCYRRSPQGNKAARAEPFEFYASNSMVILVQGPWIKSWLDEHLDFSEDALFTDQVDATSGAFGELAIVAEIDEDVGSVGGSVFG